MLLNQPQVAPARYAALIKAAEAAARAIPPAFPLSATVAVNPFLGQTGEDFATAAARLARVAGVPLTRSRKDYAAKIASAIRKARPTAAALGIATGPGRRLAATVSTAMPEERKACAL